MNSMKDEEDEEGEMEEDPNSGDVEMSEDEVLGSQDIVIVGRSRSN